MPAAAAKTAETTAFEIPKELEFGKENNRDPAICRKGVSGGLISWYVMSLIVLKSGVDAQNAAPGMYRELFYNSLNMSTAAIRKAATIRFLQGMEFGSGKLVKKSLDAFTLDVFDGGNTMGKEGFLVFPQTVTLREKKLASPGIRSEFVDHALFGPRHMFWPPPTRSAEVYPQASWAWTVDVKCDQENPEGVLEEDALAALETKLGKRVVAFRMVSPPNSLT